MRFCQKFCPSAVTALWAFVALMVLPLHSRPAKAYILPADFLCRLVADSHKNSLKDVTLTLTVESTDGSAPEEERLYLKRPERLRFVGTPKSQMVVMAREAQEVVLSGAKVMANRGTQDLLALLLFPKGKDLDETSQRMLQALASVGIDTQVVTLARHEDGIAYVIGARVWETQKPQVWIDKTSYMPVRLRIVDKARPRTATGPAMKETRYLDYNAGLPRAIEVYEDDVKVKRSEVSQVAINQNLPESLFDVKDRALKP